MHIWLIIFLTGGVSTRPVFLLSQAVNSSELHGSEIVNDVENSTVKLIDPSIFITVRLDDWRDEHNNKAIMWSRESKYHPDFGKQYSKTAFQRTQASSRRFSIIILGIAIIFVIYIYFYNVAQERKLQRHSKLLRAQTEFTRRKARLRNYYADGENNDNACCEERRQSLVNMFKLFRL